MGFAQQAAWDDLLLHNAAESPKAWQNELNIKNNYRRN